MDLEAHKHRLTEAYDELGQSGQELEHQAFEKHPFNPLHPERWKAFGANMRALGRTGLELIRFTPHMHEIWKMSKERED